MSDLDLPFSRLTVVKGCRAHNVAMRQTARIISAVVTDDHCVKLQVSIDGRQHVYYVRHRNRLDDKGGFHANKGNPLEKVTFVPVWPKNPEPSHA